MNNNRYLEFSDHVCIYVCMSLHLKIRIAKLTYFEKQIAVVKLL